MKISPLILFGILFILTSCNGHTSHSKNQNAPLKEINVEVDTVDELGSSIMVIYQDKKNNYWFGSWETGVYRYDGKTLINYTTKHGLYTDRVDDIKEDKSGNIYLAGMNPNATITKFDGKSFNHITATPSNEWKLEANDLWLKILYQANQKVYLYISLSTDHPISLPTDHLVSLPTDQAFHSELTTP